MLGELFLNTLLLLALGEFLAIILVRSLGTLAAWKAGTSLDFSALLFSLTAWSLPAFWLGVI